MKKSIRILSVLLAITMLMGTFSVMGSAYTAYKDNSITYNDVDKPVFTVNQYASMAMDELDRMLSEEQLKVDAIVLTLDLTSVDAALTSVATALDTIGGLTSLLGDVDKLNASALTTGNVPVSRSNTEDLDIFYALLKFLDDNGTDILAKYVSHSLDLGFLNALVGDYLFNVRELAMGLLYDLMEDGGDDDYDYFEDGGSRIPSQYNADGQHFDTINNGFDLLVQDLLNYFVLGEWVKLDDYFDLPDTDGNSRTFDEYDWAAGTTRYVKDNGYDYYGWFHRSHWVTVGLGETKVVSAGAAAPAADYSAINLNNTSADATGYNFIENLMQVAYNRILVPVLNDQTRPWLRETCGITYNHDKMNPANTELYDPDYDGEPYTADDLNVYANIFDVNLTVPQANVPTGQTFVGSFNNILGDFLDAILKADRGTDWDWTYDAIDSDDTNNNAHLLQNICSVARYVLAETGDAFFAAYIDIPTKSTYENMTDQQVVSFVLRAVLNASVDWMYIPDSAETIADVAYAACEQLAWQDIPQQSYTKPAAADNGGAGSVAYNQAIVNACLNILMDVAVYNLNQSLDMNPATGTNPVGNNTGLLSYSNDYESLALQVVCWAFKNYASAIDLNFICENSTGSTSGLTMNNAWTDIDTLINAIVPIKGPSAWINSTLSDNTYVAKDLLFTNIVGAVTNLNASDLNAIFIKNSNSAFANQNVKTLVITLVTNIVNLIFPGVLGTYANLDAVLKNDVLGGLIDSLLSVLYGRRVDLLAVVLPVVCDILGLSAEQEFSEIEIYLPNRINANTTTSLDFKVFNGSSGLNTAYRGLDGNRTQDSLYKYVLTSPVTVEPSGCGVTVTNIGAGTQIKGGESVTARLGGSLESNKNSVIGITFEYNVMGEDGAALTASPLSTTIYTYIAETDGGDDEVYKETTVTGNGADNVVKYYSDVYYAQGKSLSNVANYELRVEPKADNTAITNVNKNITFSSQAYPFIIKGENQTITGANKGIYFVHPYALDQTLNDSGEIVDFERFAFKYSTPATEDEEPVIIGNNGGVPNGVYTASSTISVGGTDTTVSTRFHLYDDFGLVSAYNSAVARNRQKSDYANTTAAEDAFNAYVTALRNAAGLVLAPKSGANFETSINASIDSDLKYHNLYETYALALEAAIETLENYEISAGYENLRSAIATYSPYNYSFAPDAQNRQVKTDYEYDNANYSFFGMRDFIPHTYSNYKDARNAAQRLVDRQLLFAPEAPVEPENATQYEYGKYLEEVAQYEKDILAYEKAVDAITPVGAVEATYAIHMVNLTGDRLIYLQADLSKLSAAYALYNYTNGSAAALQTSNLNANGYYTGDSWNAYKKACDFAQATLAMNPTDTDMQGHPLLRPSRVNLAISELIECWKKLVEACDTATLSNYIEEAETAMAAANYATAWTAASRATLEAAYTEAVAIVTAALPVTSANEERISDAQTALRNAIDNLESAVSLTPTYPMIDPDVAIENGVFMDYNMEHFFAPYINQDAENIYGNGEILISGIGEYMSETNLTQDLFGETANVIIEATPSPNESDISYGSGAIVTVYNSDKSDVLATYVVVLKGDVTSDAIIDLADMQGMAEACNGNIDWFFDAPAGKEFLYASGDVNQDKAVDMGDYQTMGFVTMSQSGYINQSSCGMDTYVANA